MGKVAKGIRGRLAASLEKVSDTGALRIDGGHEDDFFSTVMNNPLLDLFATFQNGEVIEKLLEITERGMRHVGKDQEFDRMVDASKEGARQLRLQFSKADEVVKKSASQFA